jgi:hypothetical protein
VRQVGEGGCECGCRPRSLDVRLRDEHAGCREARGHGGDEVPLCRCLVPGQEGDPAREERQWTLAARCEEPFARETLLQPLDAGEHGTEAERLDRERTQAELSTRREEFRTPEHVDGHPVDELEPERVEACARHAHRQAGAVAWILEREEDALPTRLTAELRDLAFDPDAREAREPRSDSAVERGDAVDLPLAVDLMLDLHMVESSSAVPHEQVSRRDETLEKDLRGHVRRAAALSDELDGLVQVGVALRNALR